MRKLVHGRDKLLSPEQLAKREEDVRDKSESAARERRFLELKKEVDKEDKLEMVGSKMREKLHIGSKGHGNDT